MSILHILKLIFAVIFAAILGWLALLALGAARILRGLEAAEASRSDGDFMQLGPIFDEVVRSLQGGATLFAAAGISCVILSEILKSRSLIYYAGAAGAMTVALAAAISLPAYTAMAGQTASALAIAGFVAGAAYWLVASPNR